MPKKPTDDTVPEEIPITEEEIAAKMRAGLSREHALEVIAATRAHEAAAPGGQFVHGAKTITSPRAHEAALNA